MLSPILKSFQRTQVMAKSALQLSITRAYYRRPLSQEFVGKLHGAMILNVALPVDCLCVLVKSENQNRPSRDRRT